LSFWLFYSSPDDSMLDGMVTFIAALLVVVACVE
jgi:UPF0716 family protein affecting phage T7 exclusion